MKNILIAFSGKASSGKTTAANILKDLILDIQHEQLKNDPNIEAVSRKGDSFDIVEKNGSHQGWCAWISQAEIRSFATALKEIAVKYFGWDSKDKGIYYTKEDIGDGDGVVEIIDVPIPDRGRQLLINIGQSFRKIRPTIWVDYVVDNIKKDSQFHTDMGIFYLIDDMRFLNEIRLCKTFEPCFTIRISKPDELHIDDTSETDLDNETFDYYINNNGSKEELKSELEKIHKDIVLRVEHEKKK